MKLRSPTTKILIASIAGIIAGIAAGDKLQPLKLIGDIFLRLIQMNIVVLVLGHIVAAVGSMKPKKFGKVGIWILFYFVVSSLLAAIWGIGWGVVCSPGSEINMSALSPTDLGTINTMTISETILNFVPSNIIKSMADGNIVHVLIFGIFFGLALSVICENQNNWGVLEGVDLFNKAIIQVIGFVMKTAPAAIFCILATTVGNMGLQIVGTLAKYLAVYGTATVVFWILCNIYTCASCKLNFWRLIKNTSNISLMAVTTVSSAVTLPTTIRDSQSKCGIDPETANLVLPLGITLNSTGAAMHMAITVITISQIYGLKYDMAQLIYIAVFATLASMANAVAPGASVVSLAIIVPSMGLPVESIAIFAGIDYFVGMARTLLNVDVDVYTALLVAKRAKTLDYDVFNGIRSSKNLN